MKGSVQLKKGVWYTVIQHKDSNGQYKQKWQSTGLKERGNKKEATRILNERLLEFTEVESIKKEKRSRRTKPKQEALGTAETLFIDYCRAYIESIKKDLSPYVYNSYSTKYLKLIKMFFKDMTVYDVTSETIEDFYDYMQNERGAKNTTIENYNCVIRPALRRAYKVDKIIPDNPYEDVDALVKEKPMVRYYNKDELDKLFEAIKGNRYELAITMLAYYGFRRSELVGLRWSSIDFDHDMLKVNHKVLEIDKVLTGSDKLKTTSSYRTLPLISHIKKSLFNLKQEIEEDKKFYGDIYNTKWLGYIFVEEKGDLIVPNSLSQAFKRILKKNKLKHIRLHDLRHSCASLLLASGEVNLKQIQEWLGHADFSTTANIYSHLDYGSKVQAANILTKAFGKDDKELLPKPTPPISEIEVVKSNVAEDMRNLGIESLAEYVSHLKQLVSEISGECTFAEVDKIKKTEMEM